MTEFVRTVRVVLADGGIGARAEALEIAERSGFEIVGEAVDWGAIGDLVETRAADLVLIAGDPDFAEGAGVLAGGVATIVLAHDARAAKEFVGSGATAIVSLDCDPDLLMATAAVALVSARKLAETRSETERLRDQLETRKLVERAKGVLMQRLGIEEGLAYRRMQRASQEENRKMREIAESILSAERLYADPPAEPL